MLMETSTGVPRGPVKSAGRCGARAPCTRRAAARHVTYDIARAAPRLGNAPRRVARAPMRAAHVPMRAAQRRATLSSLLRVFKAALLSISSAQLCARGPVCMLLCSVECNTYSRPGPGSQTHSSARF